MSILTRDLPDRGEPAFRRYVVVDVFSSTDIESEKIEQLFDLVINRTSLCQTEDSTGENLKYLVAPRNSIIAKLISGPDRKNENGYYVMYPFFSSHLMFPVKPGEHVWGFTEPGSAGRVFWMSRIHEPDHVEDANYTHSDRRNLPTVSHPIIEQPSTKGKKISGTPGFPNGSSIENRETDLLTETEKTEGGLKEKGINVSEFTLPSVDEYEKIVNESVVKNSIVNEPVPRFSKRPGDLVLQGSNNSALILGTERGYKKGTQRSIVSDKTNLFPDNDQASKDKMSHGMGSIDIVVGRGRLHKDPKNFADSKPKDTQPRIVENTRKLYETDKNPGVIISKTKEGSAKADISEGDPDFMNDSSRIYLSMKTDPDTLFDLNYPDQPTSGNAVAPVGNNSAIVFKSDQVRIIARKDEENGINGSIRIIKEGTGDTDRATIVLQPDGSIMIDGPKIVIGSGIESGNGAGNQVYIGRDATESILLGDKLIDMIKALETKFNDHIHATPGGPANPTVLKSTEVWDTAKSKVGKTK